MAAQEAGKHVRPVFVCSFDCGKTFRRKDRMLVHLRSHTGERPFVCSHGDCNKTYSRDAHLKRHVQFAHTVVPSTTRVSCQFEGCGVTLANVQNLHKHNQRKHEEAPKYVCQFEGCGKICKSHKQRRRHEQTHLPVDPLICSQANCEKRFSSTAKLLRHQKTHEGYLCQETGCSAVFRNFSLLRKHKAVEHSAARACPVCGKRFLQKSNLKTHLAVHSEARPALECTWPDCGRVYLHSRNLQAHVRSFHCGKRVPCDHHGCDWTFVNTAKMLAHLPLHDPNRPLPKKKHRQKAHRKPRHRKHDVMAACLVGVDGRMKAGSYEECGLVDADDEDKVLLSGNESKSEPNVNGKKKSKEEICTISYVSDGASNKDTSDVQDILGKDIPSRTQLPNKHDAPAGQICQVATATEERTKINDNRLRKCRSQCHAEVELISELCKSLIRGPVGRKSSLGDWGYLVSSESEGENISEPKQSILFVPD